MSSNSRNGNTLLESGFFAPCRAASTGANLALAGLITLDGVALQKQSCAPLDFSDEPSHYPH
jgi:hypothetical protein